MKTPILIALSLLSLPAFADTFADRENAIKNRDNQQAATERENQYAARNQVFLRKLHQAVQAHGGAKAPIVCETEMNEFADGGYGKKGGSYVLSGGGFAITVAFGKDDQDFGHQPEPASCNIDMRDGQACQFSIVSDENGGSDDVHLENACISASLKKTTVNYGKILR